MKFYDNGTFNISDKSIAETKIVNSIKSEEAVTAASNNWDTGRYTISETHYGWFGVKLYTVTSEGRFVLNNKTLSSYVYGGNVTKHYAGGFFTVRDKKNGHYVEHRSGPTYYGEFNTTCTVSVGLTIHGIGYEATDDVKGYAYVVVNTETGDFVDGSGLEVQ